MNRDVALKLTSLASGWMMKRRGAAAAGAPAAAAASSPRSARIAQRHRVGARRPIEAGRVMTPSMPESSTRAWRCARDAISGWPSSFRVVSSAMNYFLGSMFFGVIVPLVAIAVAIWAYRAAQRRPPTAAAADERIAMLEEQVRGLLYRVWTLERRAASTAGEPVAGTVESAAPAVESAAVEAAIQEAVEVAAAPPSEAPAAFGPELASPVEVAPPPPAAPRLDLEQRLGARWATWVGIVAILFAVSFLLKWSFDNDVFPPRLRVSLGGVIGAALLLAGLRLHRRRDVPYLSEGLAGLGLGVLYLALWAAHGLYGLLGPSGAFAGMFAVTVVGAGVSVASSREITAGP